MKKNRRLIPQPRKIEMDYSEKWGKDVEEATRLALLDLKLTESEVRVTVLEEPVKGFLGIGTKLAKVRVEKKSEPEDVSVFEVAPEPEAEPAPEPEADAAKPAEAGAAPPVPAVGVVRDLRKHRGEGEARPRGGGTHKDGRGPGMNRDGRGRPDRGDRSGSGGADRLGGRRNGGGRGRRDERDYGARDGAFVAREGAYGGDERARREHREEHREDHREPADAHDTHDTHDAPMRDYGAYEGSPGENRAQVSEKPADLRPVSEGNPADGFLRELAAKMALDVTVRTSENDECVYVEIDGPDSRTVIGKRGQTLDAVQYLTNLVMNKGREKYLRVIVDVEGYRSRREKTLESLAAKLARKVEKTGRSVRLEPMNPYERKVIHASLQSNGQITTRSEGEEPYRRVIIEKK